MTKRAKDRSMGVGRDISYTSRLFRRGTGAL